MDEKHTSRISFLIDFGYFSALAILIFLAVRYLFSLFLPFLIALSVSLALLPLTARLRRIHLGNSFISFMLTSLICLIIGGVIYGIIRGVITELSDFASRILDDPSSFLSPLTSLSEKISEKFGPLAKSSSMPSFPDMIYSRLSALGEYLLSELAGIAISIPDYIFFVFTLISSTFYFIKSSGSFSSFIALALPRRIFSKLSYAKKHFIEYSKNYLFITLFLLCLTFIELFIGFSLLGSSYALLLSFVIALIDMLPVFGVGTVLIPWFLFEFIRGNVKNGVILLILYIIVSTVRSVVEHKMLSRSFDMPPLITLIGLYVGYKLFGVLGLLITPFLSSLLFAFLKQRIDDRKENG